MKKATKRRKREREWEGDGREATVMYGDLTDLNSIWQMPSRRSRPTGLAEMRASNALDAAI